ncbi:lysozyme [Saccharothrix algeriensis]|uniref:Lysozyme n=1 Tax=Saccharothrix algeriensis TaxID=173560 RepID=A0A8T8HRV8_9PSEU|nr:lysozyme [Saccharothrix algeriensis]MBM7812414.1 lysozyme [Saccharothrix algeriensis]QTR01167.1 lysozyme [Saccharothrix algeriensis]
MRALLTGAAVLATCTSLVVAWAVAPAVAAPAATPPAEDHAMGSQIARHEGRGDPRAVVDPGTREVVHGIDVSSHQGDVDWVHWWGQGKRFAYVKATEGTGYRNPDFAQQYNGSYRVGMIRGAYHFALPDRSSGNAQADYFVDHGGGWSPDGRTLPGALDMEYNPYGPTCYGLSREAMVSWVRAFSDRYQDRTGRRPVIYTSTSWWNQCAAGDFGSTSPLWVARYASTVGTLPHGWGIHTFWQYTSTPIDQNLFNGSYDRLRALADG